MTRKPRAWHTAEELDAYLRVYETGKPPPKKRRDEEHEELRQRQADWARQRRHDP